MGEYNINDGDIIYTSCTGLPLCYHVGIVFRKNDSLVVYNCTPNVKNQYGGNVVIQEFDSFMIDRKFIKTVPSDNCLDFVHEYSYANRFQKWDALRYNCEDYVNEINQGKKSSPLRNTWQTALVIGLIVLLKKKSV